jgi:uncharacterized protein
MTTRPPLPPFTRESAIQKVRLAEDGWNSRDPEKVALADSRWRNRSKFVNGRQDIICFPGAQMVERAGLPFDQRTWTFTENHIAVRFSCEWHDDSGNWCRSYGNENWEFNDDGLMRSRFASINGLPTKDTDRKFHWTIGRRPDDHPGLSDLGL